MAAYYLDEKGQIYADVAYRLGVIVKQYDYYVEKNNERNFDSTMCLTFLQNLLTIYSEFWRNKKFGLPKIWLDSLYNCETSISENNYFGIEPNMVLETNLIKDVTMLSFLTHIRNALSHPTSTESNSTVQSTGYYSLSDEFGRISKYVFIDSPDVKVNRDGTNRTLIFDTIEKFNTFKSSDQVKNHPFSYEEVNSKIELRNHRIYKVCLSVEQLKNLTIKLSTILAQPIQKQWDGLIFNEKILDAA